MMNGKIIVSTIILSLNLIAIPAQADRPKIVNGQPCTRELCVGDDLRTLSINWQLVGVGSSRSVEKGTMLGDPQAIQQFTPYWNSGLIDNKGSIALSKIRGFCQPSPRELRGQYIDRAGRRVIVSFTLIAIDKGNQKFVANSIRTILPDTGNITNEQFENIQGQLRTQYPGLVTPNLEGKPYVSVDGIFYNGEFNKTVSLWGASLNNLQDPELFLRYPGCGGDRIIPTG
jgi:hypothetical protein